PAAPPLASLMHCWTFGKLTPGDGNAAPTRYKTTMPSVKRIFRLRSTVRSDEMKAESNSSSCAAGGSCITRPTPAGQDVRPTYLQRVKPCTRLTADPVGSGLGLSRGR